MCGAEPSLVRKQVCLCVPMEKRAAKLAKAVSMGWMVILKVILAREYGEWMGRLMHAD